MHVTHQAHLHTLVVVSGANLLIGFAVIFGLSLIAVPVTLYVQRRR